MSTLQRVNLMLDSPTLRALRQEARRRGASMSKTARQLLAQRLAPSGGPDFAQRIRALRQEILEEHGAMPDSTSIIRQSRDRGW